MALYHKLGQSVANQSELITLIRGFVTHASLGWTESNHTSGGSTELLLKSTSQHMGDNGILHLISNVAGATKYLEIHAYPPNHEAFDSPDSFDAPDTDYLPGGGSYVEADEYYDSTGGQEQKIDFTFPAEVDMFGDGNTFIIYIAGGTNKWAWMGLLTDRELDFGWFQVTQGTMARASVKNSSNIRKTSTYMNWVNLVKSAGFPGGINTTFITIPDTALSAWIFESLLLILETNYNEVLDLPNTYFCNDEATRGQEFTLGAVTYRVLVPGSEASYSHSVAINKGTAIA